MRLHLADSRFLAVAAVGLMLRVAVPTCLSAAPGMPALPQLLAEADRVWRLNTGGDPVEAGRQGEALVRAAEALRAAGRLPESREYFWRAGVVRPWDLETKLKYSAVLQQLGDRAMARDVAEQVEAIAETDQLLAASRRITGGSEQPALPPLASLVPGPGEVVIGLASAPESERWLVNEVGRALSAQLGVRVGIAGEAFDLGKPNRDGRVQVANELRRKLPWTDPRLAPFLPGGKPVRPESLTDAQVIALMQTLLEREAPAEQRDAFRADLAKADGQLQWDVTLLLGRLSSGRPAAGPGRVVQLALVPVDIFGGSANFLFGSAVTDGNLAVVSYRRFAAGFTGEPPRRARLLERTGKQVLSSLGFALGVPRCADPRCARSYPSSLDEHDAKGSGLCAGCRAGFARALGHELPDAR